MEDTEKLHQSEKGQFDFSINETLTIQKIVRSTFLNPDRMKFPSARNLRTSSSDLCSEELDMDTVLLRIDEELFKAA